MVVAAVALFLLAAPADIAAAEPPAPPPAPAVPPAPPAAPSPAPSLAFRAAEGGEFRFDTGVLRGTLRPKGMSRGLDAVVHVPTGQAISRGYGLFGLYRVFANGARHGSGAWDWPSEARLAGDGAVEVRWPAAEGRPFEMRAVYRWKTPSALDLETEVRARSDLKGFESFLASYFDERFGECRVRVKGHAATGGKPGFLAAESSLGVWLMFPRDPAALGLARDGRWKLEPNPVDWAVPAEIERPLALRRDPRSGLAAVLMGTPEEVFAAATPHQAEGHYSVYLSQFGRDLKAGESARSRTRLVIAVAPSEKEILALHDAFLEEVRRRS